jgi:outer membrane protein assembly factor BamB
MPKTRLICALFFVGTAALAVGGPFHALAFPQDGAAISTEETGKGPITEKAIRDLIKQLGDDSLEIRESAAKRLGDIGEPGLRFLQEEAERSKDAEVRHRADSIAMAISQPRFFFISLSSMANLKLKDSLGNVADNSVSNLSTGINAYAKSWFKVEDAVIQLNGAQIKNNRPAKVEAISVNRAMARLHILHGTSCGEGNLDESKLSADGTLIGRYTIHYFDKTTAVIPIEYGKDVRDFTDRGQSSAVTRGKLAWTGANPLGNKVRIYITTWENPNPDKSVATIDYSSMNTACSPFCVAVSAEIVPSKIADQMKYAMVAWRLRESVGLSGPLVMGDLVVFGNDHGLIRALRTNDGTEVWKHKHGERIYDGPVCDSEHVYFNSSRGVVALSRKDGEVQWSYAVAKGAGPCLPLESKGLVFAGGMDGLVYAFAAKTGEVKWKANVMDDAPPDPPGFSRERARGGDILARPTGLACDGETLYQSLFDQSRVVAIAADTGKTRWSYQTGGWIYGAPGISSEQILIASQDKFLHCLEKRTGKLLWKFGTARRNESAPVVEDQSVFFGSCDGGFYRVNLSDGKRIWKFETEPDYSGGRAIYSTPILSGDIVYFTAMEGHVYALDKKTGGLKWRLLAAPTSQAEHGLASDGRRLFVVTRPDWDKRGECSLVAIALK